MRPRLLDLFCGQGGASVGYHRAGWDVFGVDLGGKKKDGTPTLGPLRHYPFNCHQSDALAVLSTLINGGRIRFKFGPGPYDRAYFGGYRLEDFDAIHASPPCQGYSRATAGNPDARAKYKRLIAATRELLALTEKPWVIENVEQARSQMVDPIMLCGRMFGLEADDADGEHLVLDRHRLFEANVPLAAPAHPTHGDELVGGVYGGGRRAKRLPGESLAEVAPRDRHAARYVRKGGYSPRSAEVQQRLLGIDWMTVKGMQESIPPVYAQHVGMQLLAHVEEVAA